MTDIFSVIKDDNDEYSCEGESIAKLNNIEEVDELAKPHSLEKIVQDTMQDTMDKIIDRMKKEGKIPENSPVVDAASFVDPENDEDLTIDSDVMSVFWRLVIPNKRLIDIVAEEPSITKLGLVARNNTAGCWIAFTSKKIAKRIANSLMTKNIVVDCHL
jgi:hypothetical protein